uniref:Uncharacterized protein n=1 Tax=Vannella robusta TaxID=1487602 RepID=A0A7S4IGK4_9EUKA|mmetsp:Transcript_25533/g.32522  ORF Transcript_25533/g.32522 Transcript_25533/m.32522 type:complete len:207 (+) Transcript_25533:51-671(+)
MSSKAASEPRQISVAISDALLAVTSTMSVFLLKDNPDCVVDAYSFAVLALAASAGVIRFGIAPSFVPVHKFLALIAANSVAMLSLSIWTFNDGDTVDRTTRLMACALILLICEIPCWWWGLDSFLEMFQTIVIGMCLSLVVIKSYYLIPNDEGKLFLMGVFLYLSSSILVGTKGSYGPIKRVDVFHVMLVFANFAFTKGIMLQRKF